MREFRDRVAVITGGASGIGFAIARNLSRLGAKLVLADVEQPKLDKAVNELAGEGADVIGIVTDVGDRAAVHALADQTWSRFGAAHLIMHNAGVVVFGSVQTLSAEDWEWTLRVNLNGPIFGVQAFLPRMLQDGAPGHMAFTASFAGLVPNRELAPYNVTKGAVVALAESLRKDLRGTGISASVLCPMRVQSAIRQSVRNRPDHLGGSTADGADDDQAEVTLQGRELAVEPVAELWVRGIMRDDLFIHTHKEARGFIEKRAQRILSSFANAL